MSTTVGRLAHQELVLGGEGLRRRRHLHVGLAGDGLLGRREAGTTSGTRCAVDGDVLGDLRRPGRVGEVGAGHEGPAGVADQVHLLGAGRLEGLVDDLGQAVGVPADVRAGAVVVVGDDPVLRIAVGDEAHRLRLVLLGRPGEAVHEHDRQGDVVGQRRERVHALLVDRGPLRPRQSVQSRIDRRRRLGGCRGSVRLRRVVTGASGQNQDGWPGPQPVGDGARRGR